MFFKMNLNEKIVVWTPALGVVSTIPNIAMRNRDDKNR